MKLLYDLSPEDKEAYLAVSEPAERIMYCLPYDVEEGEYIKGKVVITDRAIYRVAEGVVRRAFLLEELSEFNAEKMLGSCAFSAKQDGKTVIICNFMGGRHLPRYTIMTRACKLLADAKREGRSAGEPFTNNEPERFCPKCGRPFVDNTQICPFCRSRSATFKKLWAMTKGMRLMLLFPLMASGISLVIQFVVPILEKNAINGYICPPEGGTVGPMTGFVVVVAAMVVMDFISRILSVIQSRTNAIAGNKFMMFLRTVLYEKVNSLSLSSIQKKSTGDLMGRITTDVTAVQGFMTNTLPNVLVQIMSFIIALVMILTMDPIVCLAIFIPIPIIVVSFKLASKYMIYLYSRCWKYTRLMNIAVHDAISGERIVKAFGREEDEIKRFKKASDDVRDYNIIDEKFHQFFFPILSRVLQIGSYFIIYYCNLKLFRGEMTPGDLYQYTAYASILYAPLTTLVTLSNNLPNVMNNITKIFEIIDEEPEINDVKLPIDIAIEGDVKINHITFGYNTYDPVIKDVSLDIKHGEMIGLVGASGSGKSTLINLIMRMYDVDEGSVTIDDVNIKEISQQALRSQIGVVLQQTYLFHGSVRDNIRYAKPFATDEEVIAAAKLANAHEFICSLPYGYNTIIGSRGHTLSGGERQRIAIARAMIHDPRILILDEATAALDTETEKMIQDSLCKLMRGRTTIAIAHRLSTLRNADRLVVLNRGRLAEVGTHSELLKQKGIYYKLVMAQKLDAVK